VNILYKLFIDFKKTFGRHLDMDQKTIGYAADGFLICARYEIEDKSPPKTLGLISGIFLNRSTPTLSGQRFFLKTAFSL
jgi:hypothetical protein